MRAPCISSRTGRELARAPAVRIVLILALLLFAGPLRAHQSLLPSSSAAASPEIGQPGGATPNVAATEAAASGEARSEAMRSQPSLPAELSIWSLLQRADLVVKAVMAMLAAASLASWTVFLTKSIELAMLRGRLAGAMSRLDEVRLLSEVSDPDAHAGSVVRSLLAAALREQLMSRGLIGDDGVLDRFLTRSAEIVRTEARSVGRGMGILATIGATAPFVGLFGTVWGIMNSFIGISRAQTTNLAVVAPGIAEALLATAIGLVAAIPAVIFYNLFTRGTRAYLEQVAAASGIVGRLLSRELARPDVRYTAQAAE
jgi:biopolymer transport protein ExbB